MSIESEAVIGPYRIVERIGRGGMATVYKAHHAALDRFVAIKVLPEFFAEDPEYLERFKEEARSVARLKHPNILNVFDFGQEGGITYLVLELVDGGTLADRLNTQMDLQDVVTLLRPLAGALDHAHSQGVLHRDVKPSNILIHSDGTPVLADFGLAKMAASARKVTASGIVLGTPEYMSPEQASGGLVGPPSDIYSLGIVAYEMLTGRVPFQADTPVGVLLSHVNSPMPPTRELPGELSGHVEKALRQALSKNPRDRFANASEFVAALTPAAWPNQGRSGSNTAPSCPRPGRAGQSLPVVLVVDDGASNRELIEACLAGVECEVRLAADGPTALSMIKSVPPDLVLLDVQMPGMDGYDVCERIKSDPNLRLVPIVMITALNQTDDRVRALESGADDFMSKPVERMELVARVRSALRFKSVIDRLDSAEKVIFALASAVESKEAHSERHAQRVADAARHVGVRLELPESMLDSLYLAGMIHDLGKICVDDTILRKRGPLAEDELIQVRTHPVLGAQMAELLRSGSELVPIIRHHHERFDGRGYPDRLRGTDIPLLARILSICDAYDALVSDRPYRPRRSVEEAIQILMGGAGHQWDPHLVSLFVSELPAIRRVTAA